MGLESSSRGWISKPKAFELGGFLLALQDHRLVKSSNLLLLGIAGLLFPAAGSLCSSLKSSRRRIAQRVYPLNGKLVPMGKV